MERFPIDRLSYSSLSNFHHCPRYFELVNINKLKVKGTPHTAFGTLLHRAIQQTLTKEELIPEAVKQFEKIWNRFCKFYKLEEKYIKLFSVASKAIYYANGFFISHFGKFKVLHVEYKILYKIGEFPQNYKGFIDLVLELENGDIMIVDLKTAGSLFFFNKYKDAFKEYQLTLYKKFYSEIEKVNRDKIQTCFVVIEKDLNGKKPLALIEVSSGDVKLANADKWLTNSLRSINANKFFKNRMSCNKYGKDYPCPFYKSDNCT